MNSEKATQNDRNLCADDEYFGTAPLHLNEGFSNTISDISRRTSVVTARDRQSATCRESTKLYGSFHSLVDFAPKERKEFCFPHESGSIKAETEDKTAKGYGDSERKADLEALPEEDKKNQTEKALRAEGKKRKVKKNRSANPQPSTHSEHPIVPHAPINIAPSANKTNDSTAFTPQPPAAKPKCPSPARQSFASPVKELPDTQEKGEIAPPMEVVQGKRIKKAKRKLKKDKPHKKVLEVAIVPENVSSNGGETKPGTVTDMTLTANGEPRATLVNSDNTHGNSPHHSQAATPVNVSQPSNTLPHVNATDEHRKGEDDSVLHAGTAAEAATIPRGQTIPPLLQLQFINSFKSISSPRGSAGLAKEQDHSLAEGLEASTHGNWEDFQSQTAISGSFSISKSERNAVRVEHQETEVLTDTDTTSFARHASSSDNQSRRTSNASNSSSSSYSTSDYSYSSFSTSYSESECGLELDIPLKEGCSSPLPTCYFTDVAFRSRFSSHLPPYAEDAVISEWDLSTGQWVRTETKVALSVEPFSRGNMRASYYLIDFSKFGCRLVAKRYLKESVSSDQYFDDVSMHSVSGHWARLYNSMNPPKKVTFVPAAVVELPHRHPPLVLAMEPLLEGAFEKYNNNCGYIPDDVRWTPQAFSHFTYIYSQNELMIVDIQGVNDLYTDPQILSPDGEGYGRGNLGYKGIRSFFKTHHCNSICFQLGLAHRIGHRRKRGGHHVHHNDDLYSPQQKDVAATRVSRWMQKDRNKAILSENLPPKVSQRQSQIRQSNSKSNGNSSEGSSCVSSRSSAGSVSCSTASYRDRASSAATGSSAAAIAAPPTSAPALGVSPNILTSSPVPSSPYTSPNAVMNSSGFSSPYVQRLRDRLALSRQNTDSRVGEESASRGSQASSGSPPAFWSPLRKVPTDSSHQSLRPLVAIEIVPPQRRRVSQPVYSARQKGMRANSTLVA